MDRCLILGGGLSGRAAARLAADIGMEPKIVSDTAGIDPVAECAFGSLIVTSPGVKPLTSPLYRAALARAGRGECELISELEFGFRHLPGRKSCLAITGTNGKTTTTELVCHLLRALGIPAEPAGNIGLPLSDTAAAILEGKLSSAALPVVETSSFQLERVRDFAPAAAALLNLESDHEDRYAGGFDEYVRVKRRIFDRVPPENRITGLSLPPEPAAPRRVSIADDWLTVAGTPLLALPETRLNAPHNREKLAAAVELCLRVVPAERLFDSAFAEAVRAFSPGRHRIETVLEAGGIRFIDDSKATNPASVVAALRSVPGPVVLLLGGLDKAMDFSPLAEWSGKIRFAVFFGECREKIRAALPADIPGADCGTDFELAVRTRPPGRRGAAQSGLRQHGHVPRLPGTGGAVRGGGPETFPGENPEKRRFPRRGRLKNRFEILFYRTTLTDPCQRTGKVPWKNC